MLNNAAVTKRALEGAQEEMVKKRRKSEAFASVASEAEDTNTWHVCYESRHKRAGTEIPIRYMGVTPEVLSECDEESEIEGLSSEWEYLVANILCDDDCDNQLENEPLPILTEIQWSETELLFFCSSILDSKITAEPTKTQCCLHPNSSKTNDSVVNHNGSPPQAFSDSFDEGHELELDPFKWEQYVQRLCDDFNCCTYASTPTDE